MTVVTTDANCAVAGGLTSEPKAPKRDLIIVSPGAQQTFYLPTAQPDSFATPEEEDLTFLYACRPRLAEQLDRES